MMVINVCIGSACHLKGSYNIVQRAAGDDRGKQAGRQGGAYGRICLGHCTDAVSVQIGEDFFPSTQIM